MFVRSSVLMKHLDYGALWQSLWVFLIGESKMEQLWQCRFCLLVEVLTVIESEILLKASLIGVVQPLQKRLQDRPCSFLLAPRMGDHIPGHSCQEPFSTQPPPLVTPSRFAFSFSPHADGAPPPLDLPQVLREVQEPLEGSVPLEVPGVQERI